MAPKLLPVPVIVFLAIAVLFPAGPVRARVDPTAPDRPIPTAAEIAVVAVGAAGGLPHAPRRTAAPGECGGVDRWWAATTRRRAEAAAMLATVENMYRSGNVDVAVLRAYAERFAALEREQRASDPPPAEAALNDHAATYFGAYGAALAGEVALLGGLNPLSAEMVADQVRAQSIIARSAIFRMPPPGATVLSKCALSAAPPDAAASQPAPTPVPAATTVPPPPTPRPTVPPVAIVTLVPQRPTPPPAAPPVPPTPTPAGRPAPPSPPLLLPTLLPGALSLPQGQPFRLDDGGPATLADLAAGLPEPVPAERRLRAFGWQEGAYRVFASDDPPPGAAGWVELHIHRFATVDGAAEALPYVAQGRMAVLGLGPLEVGLFGDQTAAVAGPAYNGDEVTIYARRGHLLVRATAIAPDGDPTADATAAALVPLRRLIDEPDVVSPALLAALPAPEVVPAGLRPAGDRGRSAATIADTFADPEEAGRRFEEWGWREHAARAFVADGAGTANGTTRMDVAVYRFATPWGAERALPYFLGARAAALGLAEIPVPAAGEEARAIGGAVEGGREATAYVRAGADLIRVTAVSAGDPLPDVVALLG